MRKKKTVEACDVFCDVCGKKNDDFFQFECSMCKADLCIDCYVDRPYEGGDYPRRFCEKCFEICESFIEKIHKMEEKFYEEVEKVEQEMAEACRRKDIV